MKYLPAADQVSTRIELSETTDGRKSRPGAVVSLLTPLDPLRQAKRLPIRVIKMLTAHTGHLLHPDYLQPLTSAPVSIEVLNAFKTYYDYITNGVKLQQCIENVMTDYIIVI